MIRGEPVALPPTRRRQIGHSNVLAPEFRTPQAAWGIALRLLEKACMRLRDEGFHAARLLVRVRSYSGTEWTKQMRFQPCNQTFLLLSLLKGLWQVPDFIPSHVEVCLQELVFDKDVIADLFDEPGVCSIDAVLDNLNTRFGSGTVTVAASLPTKDYLNHARIPFGKPRPLR